MAASGPTPTLALGVSAPGAKQVDDLAKYVRSLKDELAQLKAIAGGSGSSGNIAGLDQLTGQITRMRREMAVAVQGIRTDLAAAFKSAAQEVTTGADAVAEAQTKAAAKLRVSGQALQAEGNVKYTVSGSGLSSAEAVKQLQATVSQRPEVVRVALQAEALEYQKQADRMKTLRGQYLADQAAALKAEEAQQEAYRLRVLAADAAFTVSTQRNQARRALSARSQLDVGIDPKLVTASYGSLAVQAAQAAPSVDHLKDALANMAVQGRSSHAAIVNLGGGLRITSGSLRELGTGVEELAGGNMGRLRQTFFSFLNQMGLMGPVVKGILSPLGLAAIAVGAIGVAAEMGEKQVRDFNNTVRMTGGYAGITRGQFEEMAQSLASKTFSSIGTAKEALSDLAKTGRFTGDALVVLGQAAISQSHITGESLSAIAKDYARMPDGIYKWAEEHNKSMHFMTEEELAHIHTLEQHGLSIKALMEVGDKLNEHMAKEAENLGTLQKLWRGLSNAVSATKDALLSIGREDTTNDKLKKLNGELALANAAANNPVVAQGQGHLRSVADIQKDITFYQRLKDSQEEWAKGTSDAAVANEKASKATDDLANRLEKYNKNARERKELDDLHRNITQHNAVANPQPFDDINNRNGTITPEQQRLMENDIHQRINGTKSVMDGTQQVLQAAYQAENTLATSHYREQKTLLDESYRNQFISEGQYYANSLSNTKQYSDALLADLAEVEAKRKAEADKEKAALGPKNMASDQRVRQTAVIDNRVSAENIRDEANAQKVLTQARAADQTALDNYLGSVIKSGEANDKYWAHAEQGIKKEAALEKMRHDLAGASDLDRARAEAMIKVEESQSAELLKLQTDAEKAAKAAEDLKSRTDFTDDSAVIGLLALEGVADTLAARFAAARAELDKLKAMAADAAGAKYQYQQDEAVRKEAKDLGKTVTDKLADAILSGGKTGFKGLMDWASEYLLRRPLKMILQGILQPVGNMVANAVLGQSGLGSIAGSALSSAGGSYLGAGLGGFSNLGSVGYQYLTGGMSGANALGTIGANASGGGLDAFLAANGAYGTAAGATGVGSSFLGAGGAFGSGVAPVIGAGGVTTGVTFGAVDAGAVGAAGVGAEAAPLMGMGPVGWVALAALAAYAIFSKAGGGPKTESAYQYNFAGTSNPIGLDPRTLAGDQSQAKGISDTISGAYKSLADTLGIANSVLKVGVLVSADPKGTAKTIFGVTTSAGYDRNARTGGIENIGRTEGELQAAIAEETTRAVFDALLKNIQAGKLSDYLHQFNAATSSLNDLNAALEVAKNVGALDKALVGVGSAFQNIRDLAIEGKQALIDAAGGVDQLVSKLTSYYKNFYTVPEQRQGIQEHISSVLSTAGLNVTPQQIGQMSRAQYRSILDSVDVSTKSGAALYNTLLNLSDVFASITEPADNGAKALQDTVSGLTETVNKFKDFGKSLREFRDGLLLGELSPLTPAEKYSQAAAKYHQTYTAAMSGDADALSNLQGDAQAFLQASRDYNASNAQYTHDFSEVQGALTMAAASSDSLVTLTQQQLTTAQSQLDALTTLNAKVDGLDQDLVDGLKNKATDISHTVNPAQEVTDLYQSLLHRTPDQAGLSYWTGLMNNGYSVTDVANGIKNSQEYLSQFNTVTPDTTTTTDPSINPNYVGGDSNGPTVYAPMSAPADDSTAVEIRSLSAEVKLLREQQMAGMRAQVAAMYDSTDKSAEKIVGGSADTVGRAVWSDRQKVALE